MYYIDTVAKALGHKVKTLVNVRCTQHRSGIRRTIVDSLWSGHQTADKLTLPGTNVVHVMPSTERLTQTLSCFDSHRGDTLRIKYWIAYVCHWDMFASNTNLTLLTFVCTLLRAYQSKKLTERSKWQRPLSCKIALLWSTPRFSYPNFRAWPSKHHCIPLSMWKVLVYSGMITGILIHAIEMWQLAWESLSGTYGSIIV